ncbi:uncharacterized protein BDZ99DRAFT_484566 [Mytilinidion resinicola]|uniref:DUF4048 domain-containing protein n=1 Tax=Mytilinidion resinicola TaxID=574789 RepID=A0A6A6Z3B1_9PEZI|nr:uncharacterized protein BDZ99DRAFT_484566 [Mytilinidion resinicola]KAF2815621.1 hypothetical protein BDZ99DRAFT_484566 [Mytilinidion resinicola]
MSSADVVRDGKRLSLNFPITPAAGSTSPSRSRPQSWVATPITSPEIVPSPTEGSFLTVLAAQERRVLELKEELNKAERDLVDLKKQWTRHEGLKQRNDVRRVQQLQPLNTGLANITTDDDDQDGSSAWMQKEMERRKALLSNTKTSQRKVFSGSRHTRTLSLLSPDKLTYSPSFPQPADVRQSLDETLKRQPLTRTSTTPDIATTIANSIKDERYDLSSIQRDILLQTGKRVAIDLKDGLMTFLEDLRQATVGDEAVQQPDDIEGRPNAKRQSSKASLKSGRPSLNRNASLSNKHSGEEANLIDISESFWKENGLDEPKSVASTQVKKGAKKTPQTPQKSSQKINDNFEDSWDTWDTPNEQHTTGSSNESDSEDSARSSPRTSTSSTGLGVATPDTMSNRNSIPWPDLVKLSPNNLKRTASHLMKEWEKSLTPPAESREASHASGDYVGRSASPVRKA